MDPRLLINLIKSGFCGLLLWLNSLLDFQEKTKLKETSSTEIEG